MNKTYIIAEAGVNHNGSLKMARELVDSAAEAGADAVKFQTFTAENVISKNAPKAEYQKESTGSKESQLEMVKKLELSEADHKALIQHCQKRKIQFLSTPFDLASVDLLSKTLDLPRLKIPSGEITNAPLLLKVAQTQKPIIVSTGMSLLGEVEAALGVLAFGYTSESAPSLRAFQDAYVSYEGQKALKENVTLLHCTTEYPAPFTEVNLSAMETLSQAFGLPVGFSDHTPGIAIPIAAVARGAVLIEKHFTLNRELPGPDHQASLEPDELKDMVHAIRQVEQALGSPVKAPTASELKNKVIARKSLVARCAIQKGEVFTTENLCCKRPGNGFSPMHYWEKIGNTSVKNYQEDDLI